MPERAMAAVYDPRGVFTRAEALRRVRAAVPGDAAARAVGPLTVAWTGTDSVRRDSADVSGTTLFVQDGDAPVTPPERVSEWPATLREARGGFALIAWEGTGGLVARDHLGSRPLFMRTENGVTFLASEVAPLLALQTVAPGPDLDALAFFLAGRPAPRGHTVHAGVSAFPPAHALMLGPTGARLHRFWVPRSQQGLESATRDEAAGALLNGLDAAVRRHGGDGPGAGVLLSGGLDSSAVFAMEAARAQARNSPPPTAFTAVFPSHPQLDERAASREVAEWWQAPCSAIPTDRHGSVATEVLEHARRWELPLAYPNPVFFRPVRDAAARAGVSVLLDGEGGDELFGCAPFLLADRVRAGDLPGAMRLARRLPGTGGRIDRRRAAVILRKWVVPGVFSPAWVNRARRVRGRGADHLGGGPAWLHPAARATVLDGRPEAAWWARGRPRWRAHLAWLLTDARAEMGVQDHLRRTADTAGVRAAHPLLDVDLIELVLSLRPELTFHPELDRALVRHALRGLVPDAVRLRRDKVSFNALLLDAIRDREFAAFGAMLDRSDLELACIADADGVRALWRDGPERHAHGGWAWSVEVWRAFAAETWLRRQNGIEP